MMAIGMETLGHGLDLGCRDRYCVHRTFCSQHLLADDPGVFEKGAAQLDVHVEHTLDRLCPRLRHFVKERKLSVQV